MAAPVVAPAAAVLGAVGKLSCEPPARAGRVLLYDGVCNLCNTSLAFIAKRDPNKNVMFCSIQSDAAQPYLHAVGLSRQEALKRMLFIEYRDWSEGSTAALRVARYMRHPWPLLHHLQAVPVPLRDSVYSLVAMNRYHLFGRSSRCQVPPPDLLDRFVDKDELLAGTTRAEVMEEDK
uniref:Thiol-disulfide oxidoreductase DCC n=1 Tax=Chlamydomonas euryale TaxID=1486919 RepID=A0A7R9VI02_9CHLO|mmetsp:Transcript_35933/g.106202  ORF Transcript_35933/g.106202 Transcript_35933/m.106202 type:complete len:177 (+) Transcript_35933:261-791(+)